MVVGRPSLADKLDFLRRPESYPWPAQRVEVIETHMSWLFVAGARVCKLKKPVRRNGIDCRTAGQRERACRRELQLNRRLAPSVYLQVLDLRVGAHGLSLRGQGARIDSLVCMRRLRPGATLEDALRDGRPDARQMRRIVARLAPFWRRAHKAHLDPVRYRRKLANAAGWALRGLRQTRYGLQPARVEAVAAALRDFAARHRAWLDQRAPQVVDGHGDLRPEHIYLAPTLEIIDCLEFSQSLRCQDPLYELAFLAMECDRLGHPELDAALFAAYFRRTGDQAPRALVEYYKAHNAFKRARIAAWHLDERGNGPRRTWVGRTNAYLRLAARYLRRAGSSHQRWSTDP